MTAAWGSMLLPAGGLAQALGEYEDRPGQRAMAAAVERALTEEHPLLVEAGTGTGKTLAYLLPALMSGKRVVISTGTKTLQEQLVANDLPLLRAVVDVPFEVVTLKGVSNYVCRRKLMVRGALDGDERFVRLRDWATSTTSGDRFEHRELAENDPLWAEVTTTTEARLGPRCAFYERCFVTKARRDADRAQLIIVNHHLFFSDLALRAEGGRVLPEYDAVIFDEAHQLEDVSTDHFGVDAGSARLEMLLRDSRDVLTRQAQRSGSALVAQSHGEHLVERADHLGKRFFADVRMRLSPRSIGDDRIALPEISSQPRLGMPGSISTMRSMSSPSPSAASPNAFKTTTPTTATSWPASPNALTASATPWRPSPNPRADRATSFGPSFAAKSSPCEPHRLPSTTCCPKRSCPGSARWF